MLPRLKPSESVNSHKASGYKWMAIKSMALRKHPRIHARSENKFAVFKPLKMEYINVLEFSIRLNFE